jgi:hypothetical protein
VVATVGNGPAKAAGREALFKNMERIKNKNFRGGLMGGNVSRHFLSLQ